MFIYDDASSASGTGYTFTEIAAAFPADIVDLGTTRRSYRCKVSIQLGDTGAGLATTTLADTLCTVDFDTTKTLLKRSASASWIWRLGTKVGTGNQASGTNGCDITFGATTSVPLMFCYGSTFRQKTGTVSYIAPGAASGELVECRFASSASGTSPMAFGSGASAVENIYNLDIAHITTAQVINNFSATAAERLSIACPTPSSFIAAGGGLLTNKDMALFGSPTQSDLRWSTAGGTQWRLVRPRFTGNAPKFSAGGAFTHDPITQGTWELWVYDVKCVDGSGVGVMGLPVKLTDNIGTVQVDTTTDVNGQISYGSGITANCIVMMDHYPVAGVYTQRHRGPFLTEVNMPYQVGYNNGYHSHRYYWRPPGYESITTTSGSFEDVSDVFTMSAAPSGGSIWLERIVP